MLVRELIEQLSEMPPELPVWVDLWHTYEAELVSLNRGGRLMPNTVWLHMDPSAVSVALTDYLYAMSEPVE